ncbi:MAG TPA: DUF72 domain-containing protein [Aggregatilineales bacterium]|nr:DUF72 domain-containing protein [Aggregatilineales bacterium]
MFYVGCALWAYDGWASTFYPSGLSKEDRLRAYANRLTAVEGNTTFYATPSLPTVRRWVAQTPERFKLCPKFPKLISHTLQLTNVHAQTTTFIGVMRTLGPRLGPLMLQLPPSFGPARLSALRDFLATLPKDIAIVVEVRHPDWFTASNGAKLDEVLAAAGAARVIFDVRPAHNSTSPLAASAKEKKPDVPLIPVAGQSFVVIRYIGSPVESENVSYFDEWVPRLVGWLKEGREVYFFTHCPYEELSPTLARTIYRRVAAQADLPLLPWDEVERPAPPTELKQLPLF